MDSGVLSFAAVGTALKAHWSALRQAVRHLSFLPCTTLNLFTILSFIIYSRFKHYLWISRPDVRSYLSQGSSLSSLLAP